MCKVPLLNASGEPAAATISTAPLKELSKFTPTQLKIMAFGQFWRSYCAPGILVFVLVLPMIIYNTECKFVLYSYTHVEFVIVYMYTYIASSSFVIRLLQVPL